MSMWLLVLLKKSEENSHEQPFEGGVDHPPFFHWQRIYFNCFR